MIDKSLLEKLKAEHPDVVVLATEAGEEIAVTPPDETKWMKFQDYASDEKRRKVALKNLVRDCLVHPSREEFQAMVEKRPGLPATFGKKLVEMAGASEEVEIRK